MAERHPVVGANERGQSSGTTFIESLRIQNRVIKALCKRDILARFGREGIGFLWLFLEPAMFTIGMTVLMSFSPTLDSHSSGSIPIAGFVLTGYSTITMWRGLTNRLLGGVSANKGLLYHRNVKVLDLIYSRAIVEISACLISLVFLTLIFAAIGMISLPDDPLKAVFGFFTFAWFSFSVACLFAYLGSVSHLFERVVHVALYLAIPLMGGFFMVAWVPVDLQTFLLWSPMVNSIELMREGYFGTSINAMYSISYLIEINSVLTLIGFILLRKIKRQLVDT